MKKYQVKNDSNAKNTKDDFEIQKVAIIKEEKVEVIKEKTRRTVTLTILFTCILFLVCTGLYGIGNGDFHEFSVVWSGIQTILGMVIGYYLGSKNG